jgi:hypothetical protein
MSQEKSTSRILSYNSYCFLLPGILLLRCRSLGNHTPKLWLLSLRAALRFACCAVDWQSLAGSKGECRVLLSAPISQGCCPQASPASMAATDPFKQLLCVFCLAVIFAFVGEYVQYKQCYHGHN